MRDCPKCNAPVDGLRCDACGYSEDGSRTRPQGDPERFRCADVDRGQRCIELGTISPSTNGSGPFFCWKHARFVHGGDPSGYVPGRRPERSQLDAWKALTRRALPVPKPLDVEGELERMAIQSEGEA